MIDTNTVRDKYASMPDGELFSFAQKEVHQLTAEGYSLLQAEFIKRKLDLNIVEQLETDKNLMPAESNEGDLYISSYLAYAFDQKENGKNNIEIINGLLELEMEETAARQLVLKMNAIANQRLKKAELEKLIGGAIFVCGIAITFLPLSMPGNRLTYIIAWSAIITGSLKFIKGMFNKIRFQKIIKTILIENNN